VHQGLRPGRFWLALVLTLCCLPLFVGLGRADIENDEAIYSFAVDRILETGDWLEPKSIPNEDFAFIEKPPLKFWIVAGPMRLGLLGHDEFGMRFWDAVMGGVAFLYVLAIGSLLVSPICGAIAVLYLFVHWPLLFEHGIRTNQMEAPLLLAYCGGVFHYLAWARSEERAARWRHIAAFVACFVLGFMTKFVAVVFLPLAVGLTALSLADHRRALVRDWRAWGVASAIAVVIMAPWFVWATMKYGSFLWETLLEAHIYQRFTSYLDPNHVKPWDHYITSMWYWFGRSGGDYIVLLGLVAVAVQVVRRRPWPEGLVVLYWGLLPIAIISTGTSKLYHYAYPFLPAFALAGGYALTLPLLVAHTPLRKLATRVRASGRQRFPNAVRTLSSSGVRAGLMAVASVALLVAVVTVVFGPIYLELGPVIFKSSGLVRPMAIAIVCGLLAGALDATSRSIVIITIASLLPIPQYRETLVALTSDKHPVRTALECVLDVQRKVSGPGLYVDVPPDDLSHTLYYAFRRVRPWVRTEKPDPPALGAYLDGGPNERPALVTDSTYQAYMHGSGSVSDVRTHAVSPAMVPFNKILLLLPGPYAVCGVDAGATPADR